MSTKILYLPRATHIRMSLDKAMKWLAAKVTDPEVQPGVEPPHAEG